ncbi:MAG: carbohydrate-binding family 9-like protein [Bacteroidales bacterium]
MKTTNVPFIESSKNLDKQGNTLVVDTLNWEEFPYKPDVKFTFAHTGKSICIRFVVQEKHLRGQELQDNGDVYKDSCVEFFFSPNGDKNYYNFEFNCIGTPHVGYGPGREKRKLISPNRLRQIKIATSLARKAIDQKDGQQAWELMAEIPITFFEEHPFNTLSGKTSTCNMYKCGDETQTPHFLSWNPIDTKDPDFHRPEFFGTIVFD